MDMEKNNSILLEGTTLKTSDKVDNGDHDLVLAGFVLISLLASELGNASLFISLYRKQIDSIIAVLLKSITVCGIINGFLVTLPTFMTLVNGGWLLGNAACVVQGIAGNATSIVNYLLMLCLAFERYTVVIHKKTLEPNITMSKVAVVLICLLSVLVGSAPLASIESYHYISEVYGCNLSGNTYSIIFDICTQVIPAICVVIITTVSVINLGIRCNTNRVMDFNMATTDSGTSSARHSGLRASLFPRQTEANMTATSSGITVAQSKATVALAYFNIPMALTSLVIFGFKIVGWNLPLGGSRLTLLRLSSLLSVTLNLLRPYVLLSVSSALRKSFINFLRRRPEMVSPTFRVIGVTPAPRPRENIFATNEVPDFLRPTSSMRIQVGMSSTIDLKDQSADVANEVSPNASGLHENGDSSSFQHSTCSASKEDERCHSSHSGDSIIVRVGTSLDHRDRWSVSTGSVITLDLPDLTTVPFARPRSHIGRRSSENTENFRIRSNSMTPPKCRSVSDERPIRRETLTLPMSSHHANHNANSHRDLISPYKPMKKFLPSKSFVGHSGDLLPTVLDLGSKECSPRSSNNMSIKSNSFDLQTGRSLGDPNKEKDTETSRHKKDSEIFRIEITDLTEIND